jgi:hypothetical protein
MVSREDTTAPGRLARLRSSSPAEAARLVFRKAVYRKNSFLRVRARAGDTIAPDRPLPFRLEIVGEDGFERVLGSNPHLTRADIDRFRARPSRCITIWDGDRLASSSWMTLESAWVEEFDREVTLAPGEHYSCRSWVDPAYRGHSLLGHMLSGYAASIPADDQVWGLILARNVASLLAVKRIGWRTDGMEWTSFVGGIPIRGSTHHEPRPILPDHE